MNRQVAAAVEKTLKRISLRPRKKKSGSKSRRTLSRADEISEIELFCAQNDVKIAPFEPESIAFDTDMPKWGFSVGTLGLFDPDVAVSLAGSGRKNARRGNS